METTPDIVVINLGTNDNNVANNVSAAAYVDAYKKLIQGVHGKYPNAQVVVMVSENAIHTPYSTTEIRTLPFFLLPSMLANQAIWHPVQRKLTPDTCYRNSGSGSTSTGMGTAKTRGSNKSWRR